MHSDVLEFEVAQRPQLRHGSQALPPLDMCSPPADENGDHPDRQMPDCDEFSHVSSPFCESVLQCALNARAATASRPSIG
jgi:hypothetical protein